MKTKFNLKILAGFGLLILILSVAGIISYRELYRLETSVNTLLNNNYKSIEAAKSMVEALEREDSGILMILLGQLERGSGIVYSADSTFLTALATASGNITEPGEEEIIDKITDDYLQLKIKWESLLENEIREAGIDWYNNFLHQDFLTIKQSANTLMDKNQERMYDGAKLLKDKARRAIMPGIMAIIASVIFSLLFNFFITVYFTSPLNKIIHAVSQIQPKDRKIGTTVKTNDELKTLEKELNNMIERLSKS